MNFNQRNNKQKNKKQNKKSLTKTFFIIVSVVTLSFCIVASIFAISYIAKNKKNEDLVQTDERNEKHEEEIVVEQEKSEIKDLNIMIFGVDKEKSLSDVNMIVRFDPKTSKVQLVSIPRDTYFNLKKSQFAKWKEKNKNVPTTVKLTDVHSYVGSEATIELIEIMFEVDIDYYVKLDLDGFKKIVNTVGGVEIDVPRNMYYPDPAQDLYINLKKGLQTLDGDKAEQFVRYRGSLRRDLERMEMQQLLIKELAKKILKERNVIVLTKLAYDLFKYVETDFPLTQIPTYLPAVMKIDVDNMTMYTLPGEGERIDGIYYHRLDEEEYKKIMKEFVKKVTKE